MKDYYSILGVKEDASLDEIRSAWRNWMKKVHPDTDKADKAKAKYLREGGTDQVVIDMLKEAHDKKTKEAQEINEAYNTLSDKKKRAQYDRERKSSTSASSSQATSRATSRKTPAPSIKMSTNGLNFGSVPYKTTLTGEVKIESSGGKVTGDVSIEKEKADDEITFEIHQHSNDIFPITIKVSITNKRGLARNINNRLIIVVEGEVYTISIKAGLKEKSLSSDPVTQLGQTINPALRIPSTSKTTIRVALTVIGIGLIFICGFLYSISPVSSSNTGHGPFVTPTDTILSYYVQVDYDTPIEEMLEDVEREMRVAGIHMREYTPYLGYKDLWPKYRPSPNKEGVETIEIILWRWRLEEEFETSGEIIAQLQEEGLRPIAMDEFLSLMIAYPDFYFPMMNNYDQHFIILGSTVYVNRQLDKGTAVPYIVTNEYNLIGDNMFLETFSLTTDSNDIFLVTPIDE